MDDGLSEEQIEALRRLSPHEIAVLKELAAIGIASTALLRVGAWLLMAIRWLGYVVAIIIAWKAHMLDRFFGVPPS